MLLVNCLKPRTVATVIVILFCFENSKSILFKFGFNNYYYTIKWLLLHVWLASRGWVARALDVVFYLAISGVQVPLVCLNHLDEITYLSARSLTLLISSLHRLCVHEDGHNKVKGIQLTCSKTEKYICICK